ncbi:hypothetical protein SK854_20465 [Lentzea sp. BCCO 10_0061]|uniref:Uncharacterized protein n=1 Tax=Lentzea sokolovensis TaxID=3095429 RepID=A0ABU4UYG0_9PSEU|nr:hypothetical protein [Lentzea sp. BCCO 10_0061]MDX8144504.1 hypothetical protein [Lentzea sp. BCCO 10_0061]
MATGLASPEGDAVDAISRYLDLVEEVMRRYPDQREGQAHYNALRMGWPHLEAQVLGTDRDCYSSDKALPALLAWVDQVLPGEAQDPDVPA